MLYDYEKERREALAAGERALISLRQAAEHLESARGWGVFDLFGGGLISSLAKRSNMRSAQENMEQARYDLREFSQELRDVEMTCDLNLETDDFLSFADWFFDGFIVDWMMQDRINAARGSIAEAISRVEEVMQRLSTR